MKSVGKINRWSNGIANSIKEDLVPNSCAFSQSINYRQVPRQITLLPKTSKESGTLVTDFPQWAERIPTTGETFIYGDTGNIYNRSSSAVYTLPHAAPNSSGNGLAYFGEDKYLYYATNTALGRYGQIGISTIWYDDFLGSEGGAPTNTNSLQLLSASSQYAFRASTASLQITGNILLEAEVSPTTLPASGSTMTLLGKWDESGATRSYIMDISGTSNVLGSGADGALTVAADVTDAPIDAACSGTSGATSLSATNVNFAAGQKVLIIQMQGTGAGTKQENTISAYTAGTISLLSPLNFSYSSTGSNKAQVIVQKQYTTVTVNSGKTLTVKAWNGTVGGILSYLANGAVTITGTISGNGGAGSGATGGTGGGFRGGNGVMGGSGAYCGEGTGGPSALQNTANGSGGGAYGGSSDGCGSGGGNAAVGAIGGGIDVAPRGEGGLAVGTSDLTTMTPGGGGGGGHKYNSYPNPGAGGAGGAIIHIRGSSITVTGAVNANGGTGATAGQDSHGAGGSGGDVLLEGLTVDIGTTKVSAIGGLGGGPTSPSINKGGDGSTGRVRINYLTSVAGTSTPAYTSGVDATLSGTTGYSLRLGISSTGSNSEYLIWDITNLITLGSWTRWSIAWLSATSTATFYQDGQPLGTKVGTLTAIHSNAGAFSVGTNKNGAGSYTNFFNGLVDDIRVHNINSDDSTILNRSARVLTGSEAYLQAYYKFDATANDSTANANNLTLSGSPSYSVSVPFSGVTTRTDQDQSTTATGQTYTLLTTVSEAAADRQTFVPAKDPQKSIRVYIDTIGTGTWTLTVHDALNRIVANSTTAYTSLNTGFYEFVVTAWRPIVGATYHFHLTVSTGTSKIRTSGSADMETCDFATFYQFLVSDTWHPMRQIVNLLAIGNERYLATYDGVTYNNQRLTLPAGTRIRVLAYWREYLAIGTWKGNLITDFDEGKIFFWDGISVTYNFFIDVPEGGINAMFGSKGKLYIWAGYLGDLLLYQGGVEAQKVKRLPKMTIDKFVEVFPGAVTMWQTLLHTGVCGNSDSTAISKGVYTWGSLNREYSDSFNFDYPASIGVTGSTIHIGMVASIGQKLLIGWKNGVDHGIDVVDPTGSCYASGTYEGLVEDMRQMEKTKLPLILKADFEPLIAGQSISVKYKADRETNWRTITESTVGADNIRYRISHRVREIQPAIDLMSTTGVTPIVYNLALDNENLSGERDV